jgi:serine/threonine protein kinase
MIGSRFAHYEITGHLGTGGMGEVYQATDSKLGRSVAIKLLPEAFAHDAERVSRFEREARVLASLNHPRIATIYGIEDAGDRKFLVMELVSGETLADRIARGPIPLADALKIADEIAEALQAAHEKGVVHRDLKPANIKIAHDGQVKVLDFGLAKAFASESPVNLSNSPTLQLGVTNAGVILGTTAHVAEQARTRRTAALTSSRWLGVHDVRVSRHSVAIRSRKSLDSEVGPARRFLKEHLPLSAACSRAVSERTEIADLKRPAQCAWNWKTRRTKWRTGAPLRLPRREGWCGWGWVQYSRSSPQPGFSR